MEWVPEGGGSHHWKVTDQEGRIHFVTVDDLANKDWMAATVEAVFEGLGRALAAAHALRHTVGLTFVVAPIATCDGQLTVRIDDRYSVSVFPFLKGRSYPFGPYPCARLRNKVVDMIVAVHQSAPAVRSVAPLHTPRFAGRSELVEFLIDPGCSWAGGPFSGQTRLLLASHADHLACLLEAFDDLSDLTAQARAETVLTHGEPHPGNVMSVEHRTVLIDWDTAALAPPERDLSLIATADGGGIERYQQATGRDLDPAVMTFYRLRWYLDDLGSAIRLFRNRHFDTPDTRRWWNGLAPRLDRLSDWLDRLS
jgi:spectinomycin phosphotransferase